MFPFLETRYIGSMTLVSDLDLFITFVSYL